MARETKEERFKRVAEKRVQRLLDSIRSLSQCANKRMYQWNDAQMNRIWGAVDQEMKKCRERFATAEPEDFTL